MYEDEKAVEADALNEDVASTQCPSEVSIQDIMSRGGGGGSIQD